MGHPATVVMNGGRVPGLKALFHRASFHQPEGNCSLHILNPKRRYPVNSPARFLTSLRMSLLKSGDFLDRWA
jgi:hypothetical protein